jgi:hypothetical protein
VDKHIVSYETLTFEHKRGVGTDEHSACTGTTRGSAGTLSVDGYITTDDEGVAAVPGGRLDPVDSVEQRGRRAIASVLGVDTLDVGVAMGGKEVHEERLGRLGEVDGGLCADVDATNRLGVDIILFEEVVGDYGMSCVSKKQESHHGSGNVEKENIPVSRKVLMSSRSSQHAMYFWPRPIVYLPLETPSKASSSSWEMHYKMDAGVSPMFSTAVYASKCLRTL